MMDTACVMLSGVMLSGVMLSGVMLSGVMLSGVEAYVGNSNSKTPFDSAQGDEW